MYELEREELLIVDGGERECPEKPEWVKWSVMATLGWKLGEWIEDC